METETTTTSTVKTSDNSEQTVQEPEQTKEQEAVTEQTEPTTEVKQAVVNDFSEIVPKKFLDKDGNVNVKELAKSYTNIEHLVNEKAQWTKEKRELTETIRQNNSTEPELTKRGKLLQQGNAYTGFLDEAKNPDELFDLLQEFHKNPTEQLLEKIEEQFSPKTIKKAAVECEKNIQLLNKKIVDKQALEEGMKVQKFVAESLQKYPQYFSNPNFASFFQEATTLLGTNLNVESFVKMLDGYANSKIYEFLFNCKKNSENSETTSEISKILPDGKSQKPETLPDVNLFDIHDTELLKKYFEKYSSKK